MAIYLDASAAVKLVLTETDSPALRQWLLAREPDLIAGDLLRTEVLRATVRGDPDLIPQARAVLRKVTLLPVAASVFDRAGLLEPPELRSLDAVHLAVALDLGAEVEAIVTYDHRMSEAARSHGLEVVAPI